MKKPRKRKKVKPWFVMPVLASDYPVYKVKGLKIEGDPVHGLCDTPEYGDKPMTRRRIRVAAERAPDAIRATLWHEFFHAAFAEYGATDLSDDEALCEAMAQAVLSVRKRVPWI